MRRPSQPPDDTIDVQQATRRLRRVLDQLAVDLNFAGVFNTYFGRPVEVYPRDIRTVLDALERVTAHQS